MSKRREPIYGVAPGATYDSTIILLFPEVQIDQQPTLELEIPGDTTKPRIVVPDGYKNNPRDSTESEEHAA
jgi:hypothetical protein